jgi:hypothetical protein
MNFARLGFVLLLASSCAGSLSHGVYTHGAVRYRIGTLPPGWRAVGLYQNDLAFQSLDSPHSVAINSTCEDHDDPPLDVLTRHLLMGFTDRETVSQSVESLDGRDALRTRVTARLDGVPVELVLVVLKKDGCVYDFTYLSPVGRTAERLEVFDRLLAQFTVEKVS